MQNNTKKTYREEPFPTEPVPWGIIPHITGSVGIHSPQNRLCGEYSPRIWFLWKILPTKPVLWRMIPHGTGSAGNDSPRRRFRREGFPTVRFVLFCMFLITCLWCVSCCVDIECDLHVCLKWITVFVLCVDVLFYHFVMSLWRYQIYMFIFISYVLWFPMVYIFDFVLHMWHCFNCFCICYYWCCVFVLMFS